MTDDVIHSAHYYIRHIKGTIPNARSRNAGYNLVPITFYSIDSSVYLLIPFGSSFLYINKQV